MVDSLFWESGKCWWHILLSLAELIRLFFVTNAKMSYVNTNTCYINNLGESWSDCLHKWLSFQSNLTCKRRELTWSSERSTLVLNDSRLEFNLLSFLMLIRFPDTLFGSLMEMNNPTQCMGVGGRGLPLHTQANQKDNLLDHGVTLLPRKNHLYFWLNIWNYFEM